MINLLAKIGTMTASSSFCLWWLIDEPECPKSLIK